MCGHSTVTCIQAQQYLLRKPFCSVNQKLKIFDRLGANNHPADPNLQIRLNDLERTDTPTNLHRHVTYSGYHFLNQLTVLGQSGKGAI